MEDRSHRRVVRLLDTIEAPGLAESAAASRYRASAKVGNHRAGARVFSEPERRTNEQNAREGRDRNRRGLPRYSDVPGRQSLVCDSRGHGT